MQEKNQNEQIPRRDFLKDSLRTLSALGIGGLAGLLIHKSQKNGTVWQIDPDICTQCEKCATECVLTPSAVKCIHAFDVCGYCELCGGYHQPDATKLDTAAENQLCPVGAIQRKYIEDPYFEYVIDEKLCIGCAKCVKGCGAFGNGSLYLQVRHNFCVNCNECAISKVCPSGAFKEISANTPYLLRGQQGG